MKNKSQEAIFMVKALMPFLGNQHTLVPSNSVGIGPGKPKYALICILWDVAGNIEGFCNYKIRKGIQRKWLHTTEHGMVSDEN